MGVPRTWPLYSSVVKGDLACFSFYTNGSSDPSNTTALGKQVGTVARTSAGKFTLTLTNRFPAIVGVFPAVGTAADDVDLYPQADLSGYAASGTIIVKLKTGATNTDLAAGTNNMVSLLVLFGQSGLSV